MERGRERVIRLRKRLRQKHIGTNGERERERATNLDTPEVKNFGGRAYDTNGLCDCLDETHE